jgi:hypothetical protein
MKYFILFNIKKLFNWPFLIVIGLYLSIAWLLTSLQISLTSQSDTSKLLDNYDMILFSIGLFNYLLLIISNFNEEMRKNRKELLGTKLTGIQLFYALIISYIFFFIVGFEVPFYLTALIQQLYYGVNSVDPFVFLTRLTSCIFSYITVWLIIHLIIFIKVRNEFLSLIITSSLYVSFGILTQFTKYIPIKYLWFNHAITQSSGLLLTVEFITWLFIVIICVWIGGKIFRNIFEIDTNEKIQQGVSEYLLSKVGCDLSMYHIKMLGLSTKKTLAFFSFIGLLIIIVIINIPDSNLFVLAKIYIGIVIPVMFSFNQYSLLKIDEAAGMVHNNFLRLTSYSTIILNRWLILFVPQLVLTIFYAIILNSIKYNMSVDMVLYFLSLNLLFSSVNIYFSIITKTNSIANLVISFIIYSLLREDIQNIFYNSVLQYLNIFQIIVEQNQQIIEPTHWAIVLSVSILMLFLVKKRLHLKYYKYEYI